MKSFALAFFVFLITSCSSTNVSVSKAFNATSKRIGIAAFKIMQQQKGNKFKSDSVCTCIAESISQTLTPYLQKAGFTIFNLDVEKNSADSVMKRASSLNLGYTLQAAGVVHTYGKATFIDHLAVQIQDFKTGEVTASAAFSGTSIRPVTAAEKIGTALLGKMR
jgi:hypothetical protein